MKKWFLIVLCIALCANSTRNFAAEGPETAREILSGLTPQGDLRLSLNNYFVEVNTKSGVKSTLTGSEAAGSKSVAKGVLFSAVIPGTGQFYIGSVLKGIAFLVVEAAALTGHFYFQNEGNDLEDQLEGLANAEWSEDAYWDWISKSSNDPELLRNKFESDEQWISALRQYEHATFSHFLPENKNQQYYENIGKYNQFIMGWNDFREIVGDDTFTMDDYRSRQYNGQRLETVSPTRNDYTGLRKDSNDNFKRATNLITVVLFNHAISALDAGLSTKRFNKRIQANVKMRGMFYNDELVPALALGVTW